MVKILFKLGFLYHRAAMDPVIEQFAADPRYDIAMSWAEEKERRLFGLFRRSVSAKFRSVALDPRFRFVPEDSGERFDVVVVGDAVRDPDRYGNTLLCVAYHGTSLKTNQYRIMKDAVRTKYQLFVEGQYRIDKFREYDCVGASEVFKIGLPKLDPFFRGTIDRAAVMTKYGLDPAKKTVLFAPTFKPTCLYDVQDAIFTETREHNLVIKLHHYSWMGKYAPHRQHKIYEKRVPTFPHARLVPVEDHNIVPFMTVADTLVSEASGTTLEFLALGKIGVVYDLDAQVHSDGSPVLSDDNRELLRGAFVHVDRPEGLGEAIHRALTPTEEMKSKAAEYRRYYFDRLDGRASARFKETVERLLAEGTHRNEPVP